MSKYTVDPDPPFRPRGRYVCDWECNEAHIFNTKKEAFMFARAWGRCCNVGWLSPIYDRSLRRDRKPTMVEAVKEIAPSLAHVTDHR